MRRALLGPDGGVDSARLNHVVKNTISWASDGADRDVGAMLTQHLPGLLYRFWDAAHSACKVLEHSVLGADEEVQCIDSLLVSRKKPWSWAKLLTVSDVYRQRCGDAQEAAAGITFVRNFGWAPQRYSRRATPYEREARRLDPVFDSLASEARCTKDRGRRMLCIEFLRACSGNNASRLLVANIARGSAVRTSTVRTRHPARVGTTCSCSAWPCCSTRGTC